MYPPSQTPKRSDAFAAGLNPSGLLQRSLVALEFFHRAGQKFAGYDGLVISGAAVEPSYLLIVDDYVELIPAGAL